MKGKETIRHGDEELEVSIFNDGSYNCPKCPYNKSFDTEKALKKHNTSVHGGSVRTNTKCENCGEEFAHRDSKPRMYCSQKCSKDDRYNR